MTISKLRKVLGACKSIYGSDEVHVQLLAKQLNMPVVDLVNFINDNLDLIEVRINPINSGYSNVVLGNMYPGMLVRSVGSLVEPVSNSLIFENERNPSIVIDLPLDLELSSAGEDWVNTDLDIDVGRTGLSVDLISYEFQDVSGSEANYLTIAFTGSALLGTVKVRVPGKRIKKVKETDPDFPDTDWIEFDIVPVSYSNKALIDIWDAIEELQESSD